MERKGDEKRERKEEGRGSRPVVPGIWRNRDLAAGAVFGVVIMDLVRSRRWIWSSTGQSLVCLESNYEFGLFKAPTPRARDRRTFLKTVKLTSSKTEYALGLRVRGPASNTTVAGVPCSSRSWTRSLRSHPPSLDSFSRSVIRAFGNRRER